MTATSLVGERRPNSSWFWTGLTNQAHVVGALIMREIHTRYGRENIGYVWLFAEPMTLAAGITLIHVGERSHYGDNMPTLPFILTGYTLYIIFRGIVNRAESTLEANQPLLYHRMVTIFDMLLARALLEAAACSGAFLVLLGFACALGLADPPARPLYLMVGIVLVSWLSWAVSMLICAGSHFSPVIGRLTHPMTYLAMPLSGCFYALAWVPMPYREWLSRIPMVQIFELLRYGMFRQAKNIYVHPFYILAWLIALTVIGLLLIRIARRHIIL
jgi:capsular polysaccharide transport system permease protein